jgi:hypothetical protein
MADTIEILDKLFQKTIQCVSRSHCHRPLEVQVAADIQLLNMDLKIFKATTQNDFIQFKVPFLRKDILKQVDKVKYDFFINISREI